MYYAMYYGINYVYEITILVHYCIIALCLYGNLWHIHFNNICETLTQRMTTIKRFEKF